MVYVMTEMHRRKPAMPSPSYFDTIKDGFRQNGLLLRPLDRALKRCREEVQTIREIRLDTFQNISRPSKKKANKSYER